MRFSSILVTLASLILALPSWGQPLPPVVTLPPDEVVQPGTLAEAKADRGPLGYGPKNVKFPEAWAKAVAAKGKGVKIAVLDTGCDVNHPWLSANIKGQYNAINKTAKANDGNGHGTHCIGIVLEALPEADIYVVKVLSDQGSGSVVDIAHGIDYAVEQFKVDIVSLSLGGPGADSYIPPALARAEKAGVIVKCAAGNDGPREGTDGYPAKYKESISIAACDSANKVANFSSRGPSVYTITPGVSIRSAIPGGREGTMSGTSMATPLAAAAAGAWVATNQNVARVDRPATYRKALQIACSHPNTRNTSEGYGLPDVSKLIGDGSSPPPVTPPGQFKIVIGWNDLSAARQAELRMLGITEFTAVLGGQWYGDPGKQPVPTVPQTMPTTPESVGQPWNSNCPGGICKPGQQGGLFPNFQPFGGIFRRNK